MHIRSQIAHQFIGHILPYLSTCSCYLGEMNLDEMDSALLMESSTQGEDCRLRNILGSKRYQKAREVINRFFSFDLCTVRHLHPFFISSALTEHLLPSDKQKSLDEKLWDLAGDLGLRRDGLESFVRQLEVLQEISPHETAGQLYRIAKRPSRFRKQMRKLVDCYVDQDISTLYKKSKNQLGGMRWKMLYSRNDLMAEKLASYAIDTSVFATVGAAHLGGAKGMLRIMKKKGFNLVPIRISLS